MQKEENPRYNMWCRLIPGYATASDTVKRKLKSALVDRWSYKKLSDFQPIPEDYPMNDSLACCNDDKPVAITSLTSGLKWKEPIKERKMNMYAQAPQAYAAASVQAAINPDADKIKHLTKRLDSAERAKDTAAMQAFGFNDDMAPSSPKELVDRIKAGEFTFEENNNQIKADGSWTDSGEEQWHDSPWHYLSWRIKPIDRDGYKAFKATLKTEKQKAEDAIRVLTPAEGLAALQAFESTTLH